MESESIQLLHSNDSSSASAHWNHDVFLSYRVEDTHKNFTDHLYVALVRAGIRTFRYDRQLPVGNNLWLLLGKAIRESRVSIVVFSKDYASSEWCLDELVKIVECKESWGQLIIPIFYNVDSNDVRKQSGPFADAFARHEVSYVDEIAKVERWRLALREATKFSGWELQKFTNGHEATFIQEIVRHVLGKVKITKIHVTKHPVGLESRVKKLLSLLKVGSDDVKVFGVYGMGGVGKSTIAKSLYNSAFHLFEGSCFLANVREVSEQPNGLVRLQEQLLSQTLGKKVKVANVHIGITYLKERLCYKRVLMVLDDVDQLSQLEALAGERHWFGLGSRVIMTTRNEHLLSQAKADEKYEAKELNGNESLRLFSWHAFRKPVPLVNYKKLSKEIVSYTRGLPLALEVLGASLLGQSKKELWHSTLEKLRKIPPNKILEKLRISFDSLDDDKVKNIFLDIACFFIGMDKDYAIDIFNGCGFFPGVGINILIDRCLLRVSWENKLKMHDLVRDMGRKIVDEKFPNEPGKRSRIWSQKDVLDVLRKYKGSEAIEGLVLDLLRPMHLSTKAFERMHKLRLLQINNVHLDGNFEGLFEELRWLCWHHCPLDSLPVEFHPGKLVFLDLQHNNFNTLWQGTKFLGNLKILNIGESESLTTTPDFSGVPNLERLSLMSCPRLSDVSSTIGLLGKLTSLDLGRCDNLKNLPSSICNLRSLETLSLGLSPKIEQLPEKLGDMEQLRRVDLASTAIKELPDSIGSLCNLSSLALTNCENLRGLPSSICNVESLEYLYMNGCSSLHDLPEDVGNIKCLRVLSASGTAVERLPESIGLLGELTGLHLQKCKNLRTLPSSVCNLISLEILNIESCLKIELGESAQIWYNCLSKLTRLYLKDCNLSKQDIPHNFGAFLFLEELSLEGNNFCSLPSSLGQLSNLVALRLGGCRNLQSVEVFPPNLIWLSFKGCSSLEKLRLSTLRYLENMDLKNCSSLVEIHGLENLHLMSEIHMEGCRSLSAAFTSSLIQGQSGLVRNCATYFSRMEIPNWFEYQTTGNSSISVDMPLDIDHGPLQMTIWADYSFGKLAVLGQRFRLRIINITNGDELTYILWGSSYEVGSWVRHVSPDYPMKSGDRIKVYLELTDRQDVSEAEKLASSVKVEKYGVHLANMKQFSLSTQTKRGLNTNMVDTNPNSKSEKTSDPGDDAEEVQTNRIAANQAYMTTLRNQIVTQLG